MDTMTFTNEDRAALAAFLSRRPDIAACDFGAADDGRNFASLTDHAGDLAYGVVRHGGGVVAYDGSGEHVASGPALAELLAALPVVEVAG